MADLDVIHMRLVVSPSVHWDLARGDQIPVGGT